MSDADVTTQPPAGVQILSATELGALADQHFEAKTKRLAADKVAKELKTEESRLEALIIDQMRRQQISSIGGKKIIYAMPSPTDEPVVEDWPKFQAHILETKDFSLLERRPGRAAIKERWEQDKAVPGVGKFPVYKLSKSGVK